MSTYLVKSLKLYLVNWDYTSDYRAQFLRYRKQNRYVIKDQYKIMESGIYTDSINRYNLKHSDFNIYAISKDNISKDYLETILKDIKDYPGKNIVFITNDTFTNDQAYEIDRMESHYKGLSFTSRGIVALTKLLLELRFADSGWSTHTEGGKKFYYHSDDTAWEYV